MRWLILGLTVASASCAVGSTGSGPSIPAVAPIRAEMSHEQQVDHVLNRLAYGPRPGDAERVRRVGLERWIALQLAPEAIDDRGADSVVAAYRTLSTPTSELASISREVRMARRDTTRAPTQMDMDARRTLQLSLAEVSVAKLARAVSSERQLHEQMVDFWENHFSVFAGKGQTRLFIPAYDRDVIRPRAMGKFRDLLGAVAKSPAMLFYLDNAKSTSRGLNENYARELLELHTLGVDGGYTQQDVIQVARALTGWSIDPRAGEFVFRPRLHDESEKTVLGHRLSPGRGMEDGEQVLDILARHPATARFIANKLAVRFVSDSAPTALVERCAAVFGESDGDIRKTVQCVVTSPEFFSKAAYRAKIKTPFELVASALRATNASLDGSPRSARIVAQLGQPIFGRQTPDGWPDRAEEWVNAGTMANRVNFGLSLAAGRVPGVRVAGVDSLQAARITAPEFQKR